VAQPLKESDINALPDPELNPLLNPILAAHMGRWAEVYFTTPPERRGQAISELLQQLKSIPAPEAGAVAAIKTENKAEKVETEDAEIEIKKEQIPRAPGPSEAEASAATCGSCAYENSPGQFFCGRCGAPLRTLPEKSSPVAETTSGTKAIWSEAQAGDDFGEDFYDEFGIDTAITAAAATGSHDAPEPDWMQLRRDLPGFIANAEAQPARNPYRVYIGGVLAILLVALVYMGWRGTKTISGAAKQPSAPAIASPAQPTPVSEEPAATENTLPQLTAPASPVRSKKKSESRPQPDQAAASQPAPEIAPAAADSAVAAAPAGNGDMAQAEKYLNGTRGTPRDTKEAVPLLWKAVGKGNLAATLALSDLYLRGDGVPKSCDQARLLLDVAAKKGGAAAAERLHNLQAFGCQ